MARSRWKFSFFTNDLWRITLEKNYRLKKKIKSWKFIKKSSQIPPILNMINISIDKGSSIVRRKVNKWMIGHRVGEFAFTRKPFFYPVKKRKKSTRR